MLAPRTIATATTNNKIGVKNPNDVSAVRISNAVGVAERVVAWYEGSRGGCCV